MARFFRRGLSKVFYVPTISDPSHVQASEINAGVDLSSSLAAISGFVKQTATLSSEPLSGIFTRSYPGQSTVANSSLTFYDDDSSTAVHSVFPENGTGNILFCPYGRIQTKRCEVWPILTLSASDTWDMGNNAARFVVGFSFPTAPVQNSVLA